MNGEEIFYKRNLPHIHPKEGFFFITFRLSGTIPKYVLERLREERENQIKTIKYRRFTKQYLDERYKADKRFFASYDKWLDECNSGPVWLKNSQIARIVYDKMMEFDTYKYKLVCFCIMSNHVHLLIDITGFKHNTDQPQRSKTTFYYLADVLRLIKGSTARQCNKLLNRSGQFWHHESYDHYVRDEKELARIIKYILNNPVKAGLTDNYSDWEFSYYKKDFF
ncbi:MAG TPA: hypothetical protein ENK44_02235 [Caldithrix abyssi]|uniref:Transposase IS200-like domain-containing protein n=1 Tax=Caldithrix abyssi TaxID=187145 RepID=A0A7V4WTT9_CALAY|nr:hypothetical protein [Caldithrix abyssi]